MKVYIIVETFDVDVIVFKLITDRFQNKRSRDE